ncbi:MAG: hypothetical protein JSU95_11040 [Betaproteobacteria bacterium]|nr:MAG: hypothetical protein JSU95_11040 [Betaproteobacteria bacterium]
MLSAELTFHIETAFIAIVLPFICAYLLLVAVAASRINCDESEHGSESHSLPDRNTR